MTNSSLTLFEVNSQVYRKCLTCGRIFSLNKEYFYFRTTEGRYRAQCKECVRKRDLKWRTANRKRLNKLSKEWRQRNPLSFKIIQKRYRIANRKKLSEYTMEWSKKNPERYREIQRRGNQKKRSTPQGRINHRMEVLINSSLRHGKNGQGWQKLVNYTVENLKVHLEDRFTDGMTWEKFLKAEIHIDHIFPRSKFHFSSADDPEFKKCWALENLQPLWAVDNLRKHNH